MEQVWLTCLHKLEGVGVVSLEGVREGRVSSIAVGVPLSHVTDRFTPLLFLRLLRTLPPFTSCSSYLANKSQGLKTA